MQSTGIIRRVDELGRIVLPKDLRRKLQIKEGTCLEIFLNENELVLKEYSLLKNFEEIAKNICECLFCTLEEDVYISDLSKIIYASGNNTKTFSSKNISEFVVCIINSRKAVLFNVPQGVEKIIVEQSEIFTSLIIVPIVINGDCVGSIIAQSKNKKLSIEDSKVLQVMACLITKQLDL